MLLPSLIVNTVATVLQTIPALVTAMANDPARIVPFHFLPGVGQNLSQAVNTMLRPGLIVAYETCVGANYDGGTIFRHHVALYYRSGNQANVSVPLPGEDVWAILINSPVNGSTVPYLNIRNTPLIPGKTKLMDVPSFAHQQDEDLQDLFKGLFIFPEIGDQI